ncbi:small integral membrane protein 8-like [Crassostrea angulata]|nr:small integral membrane protein 8 [Crassostrea gigas]XP_052706201.1 small integral membrane protein 8-like [Crassostrea angulata]|eukprot:XP_019919946.1 PREDICTED: small integral membrane protein 8 [Crassostrea gigas]
MDPKKDAGDTKPDFKDKIDKQNEKFKTPGWRTLPSTSAFRAINFELYAKPNIMVMGPGTVLFLGCIGYIIYMRMNEDKNSYTAMNADGTLTRREKTSRWD